MINLINSPLAGDPELAGRRRRALRAKLMAADRCPKIDAGIAILDDDHKRPLIDGILAGSPYLSSCLEKHPELLSSLHDPAVDLEAILDEMRHLPIDQRPPLLRSLRSLKRQTACIIGLADLSAKFDLIQTTGYLTRFADLAVQRLSNHLLHAAAKRGDFTPVDPRSPSEGSGLFILGMGKHGAHELNYSSDIDLIVLFDHAVIQNRDCRNPMALAVQLARTLAHLLEQKTPDGYVFRTDLRLRPHLPSQPLALSTEDAENYYERHGQNWERAAHIKARPVAGDIDAGLAYLKNLSPFLWRKHLDYAAIKDIQSIKRQINAHHGFGTINVRGHDLKVGRGGIREIEFFAQTQQLILGGQHRDLRERGTCAAINKLASDRWIERTAADDLTASYSALRMLEHRLQMIADKQTHTLPSSDAEFSHFAHFCGHTDVDVFAQSLLQVMAKVEARYAALFERTADLGAHDRLVFTGTEEDGGTLETLSAMGFSAPAVVASTIRGWHHGSIRATRSTRAREILTELTPAILASFEGQSDKDRAFALFDDLISSLPAGVQLFSLFHANPKLLELVSNLIGAAPKLIGLLATSTDLFEAMLSPDFFDTLPNAQELTLEHEARLRDARDIQDVFDISRHWAHARQFQAGVQVFLGIATVQQSADILSTIAELLIQRMLKEAEIWLNSQHGAIDQGSFAVLALGKLGSRELSMGSDLDLIFIYQAPEDQISDGAKPIPAPTYFARLGQRLITALSAKTAEGRLYEIDTRLRPSGHAGPVACSVVNFERYHQKTGETWEQQSLTRARIVAGDPGLARKVQAIIDDVIAQPRDEHALQSAIRTMRERIFREHGPKDGEAHAHWNIKHGRGGLVEVEFAAQYLQLRHANQDPTIRHCGCRDVFLAAIPAGLIDEASARSLAAALDLMHGLTAVLRLSLIDRFDPKNASPGLRDALVRAATQALPGQPFGDFATLETVLIATQIQVGHIFDRLCPANDKPAS